VAQVGSGRVSHLWFGLEFEKFQQKMSNFSIFSLLIKKNRFGLGRKVPGSKPGWPLIHCGSKVSSGQVRSRPISTLSPLRYIVHGGGVFKLLMVAAFVALLVVEDTIGCQNLKPTSKVYFIGFYSVVALL